MTATVFSAALKLCGLSHNEAAEYLEVRPDTVHNWSVGRRAVPGGVWDQLAELFDDIYRESEDSAGRNLPGSAALTAQAVARIEEILN